MFCNITSSLLVQKGSSYKCKHGVHAKLACKLTQHLKDLAHGNLANTYSDTMGADLVKTINTSNFRFSKSIAQFVQLQNLHIGHTQTITFVLPIV